MNEEMEKKPNLVKFIGRCGAASRRTAVELIHAGRVAVNGRVETNPARRISATDSVTLDGGILCPPRRFHYIMLNKPRGYVCSNSDRHAGKLAVDLIRPTPACFLRSAGRLDKDSEGLIVFSDDGAFLERVSHPRHAVSKQYEVTVERPLTEEEMRRMREGVADAGEVLRVLAVIPRGGTEYIFRLNEGRKREIRRLCGAAGAPVKRLRRIALGALELGELEPGKFRELSPREVEMALKPDVSALRGDPAGGVRRR